MTMEKKAIPVFCFDKAIEKIEIITARHKKDKAKALVMNKMVKHKIKKYISKVLNDRTARIKNTGN